MYVYHTCVHVCVYQKALSHTDHTHLKAQGSKVDDVGTLLQHVPLVFFTLFFTRFLHNFLLCFTHLKTPGSKVDDVGTALQHVPLSSAPTTSSVLTKVRMRACDWGISALVWRGFLQCVCMFVCVRVCVCAGGCVCVRERERGYKHTHTHLHTTIHTW